MRGDRKGRLGLDGVVAAAILVTTALFSGCDSPDAASRETDWAATPAPRRGGVFRLLEEAPQSLDPAEVDSVYDAFPIGQIFDGLVALDPGLNIVPALADTWTISRDGRKYLIHLRDGVKFHDGTPLTAQDVVFSFRRILDPTRAKKGIAASYLQVVEGAPEYSAGHTDALPGIVLVDPAHVEIRLARPYLSFLAVLAMDDLRIVPEHVVTARGDNAFRRSPIGTGPFRFGSWTDDALRLDANRGYFGKVPALDQLVIFFPRDGEHDAGNARFLRREIDIVKPTSDTLPDYLADPTIETHRYQDLSLSFMGMNTTLPPLNDVRIRQAIARAIDRRALAEQSPGTRREAQGILPPGLPSYSPSAKALPYSPEAARSLLATAGYPAGRGLRPIPFFTAQSGSSEVARSIDQLRRDLAAVGIGLEIHQVTWTELNSKIERHEAPLFQLGWVADIPDPDSFLRSLFEPGGSANFFDFRDDDTGQSLERGASETHPLERARIYRALEESVLDKAPLVPLFHSIGVLASRRTVHGLKPSPMGIAALEMENIWIEPEGSAH